MRQETVRLTPAFHREESVMLHYELVSPAAGWITEGLHLPRVSAAAVLMSWAVFVLAAVLVGIHVVWNRPAAGVP